MGEIANSFLHRLPEYLQKQAIQTVEDDPDVRVGSLSNGLRYYIRSHDNPKNRAIFRFVMHVGSLHEDDDQRGLAHILEHMAFNGSTHFAPHALDAYFQSIGMQFGAHVNASTGFDKTIYKIEVPTDDPEILAQTFQVLQDWGEGLLLLDEQIEKERLVGLEEWRSRRSGRMRTTEQMLPTLYWGAKHVERMPIGTEESLLNFEHDALKRFYDDWYRPDLCSLVIVGDIDVDQIEQQIETYLGGWISRSERPKEQFLVPIPKEPMLDVIQDDTIPFPILVLSQKKPLIRYTTEGGWASNMLTHELMISALRERFKFLHRANDSQVQQTSMQGNSISPNCERESLQVALDATDWQQSITEIVTQSKQLREFGLTQTELDRAKKRRLTMLEAYTNNLPTSRSKQHLVDIMSTVLDQESLWPPTKMFELTSRWTPQITLEDVNARLKHWLTGEGLLTHFLSPIEGVTPEQIQQLIEQAQSVEVRPYIEEASSAALISEPVIPGKVVEERLNEELEIREWIFDNGVQVWLKRTDFDEDMIRWSGFADGGYSLVEDQELFSAECLSLLLQLAGAGVHSRDDLSRLIDSVPGSFRWSIDADFAQVEGHATTEGFLPTMQHMWLQSQQSTFDQQTVEKMHKVLRTGLSNNHAPEQLYNKYRAEVLNQEHPRTLRMELEDIPKVTLEHLQSAYQKIIQPLSGYRFSLIGNFDWAQMRKVLSQTIGALPAVPPLENINRGISLLQGTERHQFAVFDEPKAKVEFHFVSTKQTDKFERLECKIANMILRERLRKSLREEEAGTYHVHSSWAYDRYIEEIHFYVSFGCNPERVSELEGKARAVIERFVTQGVTSDEVELERGKMLRFHEQSIEKNNFWQTRMVIAQITKTDVMEIPDQLQLIQALEVHSMNDAICKFYPIAECCTIVGLPLQTE